MTAKPSPSAASVRVLRGHQAGRGTSPRPLPSPFSCWGDQGSRGLRRSLGAPGPRAPAWSLCLPGAGAGPRSGCTATMGCPLRAKLAAGLSPSSTHGAGESGWASKGQAECCPQRLSPSGAGTHEVKPATRGAGEGRGWSSENGVHASSIPQSQARTRELLPLRRVRSWLRSADEPGRSEQPGPSATESGRPPGKTRGTYVLWGA